MDLAKVKEALEALAQNGALSEEELKLAEEILSKVAESETPREEAEPAPAPEDDKSRAEELFGLKFSR